MSYQELPVQMRVSCLILLGLEERKWFTSDMKSRIETHYIRQTNQF